MQNSRRDHIVSCLDIVWESMSGLCESFTEDQWKLATDCPGWSVQDQLSHITGSESQLAGNPTLGHTPPESPHVKNQIGASNEAHVDYRRSRPGSKVLKEFNEVRGDRPISQEELDGAKDGVLRGYPASFERPGAVLSQLLQLVQFDLPDTYFHTVRPAIEALTLPDIHRIVEEWIRPDLLKILIVGDRQEVEFGLKELEIPIVYLDVDGRELR